MANCGLPLCPRSALGMACFVALVTVLAPPAIRGDERFSSRLFPHIRTWATVYAYPTNPRQQAEVFPWLAAHYDLVVWGPGHPDLKKYRATGKSLLYTNYCNVYKYEPMMWNHWKQWTDEHVADDEQYEAMFLHFAADRTRNWPYPDQGRVQALDRIWRDDGSEKVDITDLSHHASKGRTFLGGTDWAVYLGQGEGRFRQLNVDVIQAPPQAQVAWEYWNGAAWSALPMRDGTDGLRRSGNIDFTPPRDWKKCKVGADLWNHYYVRFRVAQYTFPLVIRSITTEDYLPSDGRDIRTKGWDPANDPNHDGFVDDREWARLANPKATARFPYQARYAYHDSPPYYANRWMLALNNPHVQQWNAAWIRYLLDHQGEQDDGVMEDNCFLEMSENGYVFRECPDNAAWLDATAATLRAIKRAAGGKLVQINIGPYLGEATHRLGREVDILETEPWIHPDYDTETFRSRLVYARKRAIDWKLPTMLEAQRVEGGIAGSEDRLCRFSLAAYYLMAQDLPAGPTFFAYGGEGFRGTGWLGHGKSANWFGAIQYNVGLPAGDWYVFAQGLDPETKHPYTVFARQYGKALMLVKPRPLWSSTNCGAASATTHDLPGTFYPLSAAGSLEDPVTSISLKNVEGAILIKARAAQEDEPALNRRTPAGP